MSTTFDVYQLRRRAMIEIVTLEQRIKTVILPELGVGVEEFAKRCGVSRQTLYKAFQREKQTGHHDLDAKTARKLAKGSGRPIRWITGEEAATSVDTLALAEEAAVELARQYAIPEDEAWKAMRGLRVAEPTKFAYYIEGGKRLLVPAVSHLDRIPDLDDAGRSALRTGRGAPTSSAPPPAEESRKGRKPKRSRAV